MASVRGISEADSYLPTRGNRSSVRNAVAQADDKLVLSSALESLPTHVPVRKRVSCVDAVGPDSADEIAPCDRGGRGGEHCTTDRPNMSIEMRAPWAVPESTGLGRCIECFDSGGEFVYRITEDLKRLLQRENVAVRRKAGMLADRRPYSTEVSPVAMLNRLLAPGERAESECAFCRHVSSTPLADPHAGDLLASFGVTHRSKVTPHGQTTMIR